MTPEQISAARSLRRALRKVRDAELGLRVYEGSVWIFPIRVELWPDSSATNVLDVISEIGEDVTPLGLNADGGSGT